MGKKFICFTGIDGSGKTTATKKINEDLKKDNFDSIYVYGRVYPVISRFSMWLGRIFFLKRKKNDIFVDYEDYSNKKKEVLNNGIFSKLFEWIILIDHIIQINLKIRIPLILGKIVVCDRYIYDTVITDISANLGYSANKTNLLIQKIFYFIPKPGLIFYINIPAEIAYSRKDDVPHINYLKDRKKYYDNLEKDFEIYKLDGSKGIEEISFDAYNIIISKWG